MELSVRRPPPRGLLHLGLERRCVLRAYIRELLQRVLRRRVRGLRLGADGGQRSSLGLAVLERDGSHLLGERRALLLDSRRLGLHFLHLGL